MTENNSQEASNNHNQLPHHYIEISTRNISLRSDAPVSFNEHILVFDMDDCLYHNRGVEEMCRSHALGIFCSKTNGTEAEFDEKCRKHGTRRMLFLTEFDMESDEICCGIESPDFSGLLKPSDELIAKLSGLNHRVFLLTNSTRCRTQHVLGLLGLDALFERVFVMDLRESALFMKPGRNGYQFVADYLGVEAERVHFFDDMPRNIDGATAVGWNGYLVQNNLIDQIDRAVEKIEKGK
ncbi:hypothetical protein ECANGB1_142 [Enterospora canceri]|uniref:Uncharacterized protein n=1 Tax=Enterospora canceri TaxID=1081671 RepID=A0A1Y1S8B1_9MICR|nr:hypothetical protein ECANGB1_142 [Enterospora canceri]